MAEGSRSRKFWTAGTPISATAQPVFTETRDYVCRATVRLPTRRSRLRSMADSMTLPRAS